MSKVKITYRELREKQREDLKKKVSRYMIYRKFSTPFTYLSLKLGLSPSAVSIINFFPPIMGYFFLSVGTYPTLLIGLALFFLFKVLDCTDGEVARVLSSDAMQPLHKNIEGPYFDTIAHYIYPVCLGMGLGLGMYRMYGNDFYLLIGFLVTLLLVLEVALTHIMMYSYRKAMINRNIHHLNDNEALDIVMKQRFGNRAWADKSTIWKIIGPFPFQGLLYAPEFFIPSLLFVTGLELVLVQFFSFTFSGITASALTIYLGIIIVEKTLYVTHYLADLKKKMFITRAIEKMQQSK